MGRRGLRREPVQRVHQEFFSPLYLRERMEKGLAPAWAGGCMRGGGRRKLVRVQFLCGSQVTYKCVQVPSTAPDANARLERDAGSSTGRPSGTRAACGTGPVAVQPANLTPARPLPTLTATAKGATSDCWGSRPSRSPLALRPLLPAAAAAAAAGAATLLPTCPASAPSSSEVASLIASSSSSSFLPCSAVSCCSPASGCSSRCSSFPALRRRLAAEPCCRRRS